MDNQPFSVLTLLLLCASALTQATPPHRDHADDYVSELLDEDNPQHYMAASRLMAVGERDGLPADVEHRLAAYLVQSPGQTPAHAELVNQITSVLATGRAESPAIGEIIDALTLTLEQQPLPVARRGAADALFMISRHTPLPVRAASVLEDRAFADADRKVRINAMRALIQAGPDEALKRRLQEVLMAQAEMGDNEFAAPETWNYDIRNDHDAILVLLWSLHEPQVPQSVMSMWVEKLADGNMHDTAARMLENVVQQGPFPEPIYSQLLTVAESETRTIDPGRREKLYRLLQRSRLAQDTDATHESVDDLELARTFALDPDIGRRRTAAHRLREFANANRPTHESLELLAEVAEREENRELRELALRILGYAAPKEYVDVMHRYFDSGQYDDLVLIIFLASYGREEWIRDYAGDLHRHPKVRAAAMYDYSRSGFPVPDDTIALLQDIARDDPLYEVRQAAGQSLRHLDAWVPLNARLERQENQVQTLFTVWLAAVGVYPLSGLLGIFFLVMRWSRVRQRFSAVGICAWFVVAVVLVPAIGIGALSLFSHNGPTRTSREMFFFFLPTYILVAYFAYSALLIAGAGLKDSGAQTPTELR